jgi:hypothetical protein
VAKQVGAIYVELVEEFDTSSVLGMRNVGSGVATDMRICCDGVDGFSDEDVRSQEHVCPGILVRVQGWHITSLTVD